MLGVIDAALGRKEEALREGRRAVELLPVEKDAIDGMVMIKYLAMIAAWVGEKDLACEQLARAVRSPWWLSPQLWRIKTDAVVGSAARRPVLRKNRRLSRAEVILCSGRRAACIFGITLAVAADTAASTAQRRLHFPRNEPPNPTEYLSERPEMSFSRRGIKEGQNKKRKLSL